MDLIYKPSGYTNQEFTHLNPAYHVPTPKTFTDKKDKTLLQMAMKAFLKERISGRISNFNKNNINNKNHLIGMLEKPKDSQKDGRRYSSFDKQMQIKKPMTQKRMHSALNSMQKLSNVQIESLNQLKMKQYVNKIQLSIITKRKPKQTDKSRNFSKKKQILQVNKSRYHDYEINRNINIVQDEGISFISAINIQNIQAKRTNLPQIFKKRTFKDQKDREKTKHFNKKKENMKIIHFDDSLWEFFSKKNTKELKKKGNPNQSISNSIFSLKNNQKQNFNSNAGQIDNKNLIPVKNTYLFDKQNFNQFTRAANLNIPQFFATISQFFDLPLKIQDKMKKIDFENVVSSVILQNKRAWAVIIFRFLDQNHDGIINSSDIFKIYNYLNEILSENEKIIQAQQNSINDKRLELQKSHNQKLDIQRKRDRQNTELSEVSKNSSRRRSFKKQRKDSFSSQISYEQQNNGQHTMLIQYAKKNIENIKVLKRQIEKLNFKLLESNKNQIKINDQCNPEHQLGYFQQSKLKPENKIVYLEEVLLTKKQLKSTDLNLILHFTDKQATSNQNKNVIDIDKKKLNVKLSSMYVQTFSATDHNEQTRLNRQYIQSLKQSLKNKFQLNRLAANESKQQVLPEIKYVEFLEKQLYQPFKQVFILLLHVKML